MKVRTVEQLVDKVNQDRVWRIREIDALTKQCELKSNPSHIREALRKAFLTMLYAHWEGFVKNTADNYLEFVAMQGLKLGALQVCFLSIYLKNKFPSSFESKKNSSLLQICSELFYNTDNVIKIDYKNVISTNSNLNFDTLEEICRCLGLESTIFSSKKNFIDMRLVGRRNKIAHGNYERIDEEEIAELKATVIEMIDSFKNEVENAAVEKRYMRT
ncbi:MULTISPECIES: MAE_28990/MAE_18760 family HEPN-like nuclease [unclassified Brucella]|uniref:MAE_28990/MAE_18760 family HEPN-like nuclease n=1 Tax=unclassified Brucella TaxID=2632610 RepID=UPI00217DD4D0|nr:MULTISPECIES: MAE_28990/MAE_18760 family HEPN-like nuclease [unclassified Brucella]UWF67893.1 MAE_28990/MAE_18760 family HEPN-like nuclease [Brucella sp. 1315]UWF71010.1 MAE_28990/MAE_18760 family HEPN-like nuclease [Brucella sp. 2594]